MRPEKREAILVILHLLHRDIPSLHGVALGAIRAHLAAMNIGMAIGAVLADIREYRLNVARDAFHFFVHPAQGIAGFVVIEFRNSAYRTPGRCGVAVLARNGQRTMRIARGFLLSVAAWRDGVHQRPRRARVREGQEHPECELE